MGEVPSGYICLNGGSGSSGGRRRLYHNYRARLSGSETRGQFIVVVVVTVVLSVDDAGHKAVDSFSRLIVINTHCVCTLGINPGVGVAIAALTYICHG